MKMSTHVKINLKSFENIPFSSSVSFTASQNILYMHALPSNPCLLKNRNRFIQSYQIKSLLKYLLGHHLLYSLINITPFSSVNISMGKRRRENINISTKSISMCKNLINFDNIILDVYTKLDI